MHIVIVINTSWNVYNFRSGLIRRLIKNGWKVTALAPRDEYSEKLKTLGCNYHEIPMESSTLNPLKDLRLYLSFLRAFRKIRPDCILLYTIKPNIYASLAAARLAIPYINNISGLGTAFLTSSWLSFFVKQLYRKALKLSTTVFFQNRFDRDLFLDSRLVRTEVSQLIPGSGVDLKHFYPRKDEVHDRFTFIMVARLLIEKGVREYIEAAAIVKEKYPKTRFILIGEYPDNHPRAMDWSWMSHQIKLKIVEYHKRIEDIRPLVWQSDVVVLPSYREGLSKTLLEGAAMGKPIIATNVPGCKEVVLEGHNGYLCSPQSSRDLARLVLKLLETSHEELVQLGENSRNLAETNFDEEIVINQYLKAINESNKNPI